MRPANHATPNDFEPYWTAWKSEGRESENKQVFMRLAAASVGAIDESGLPDRALAFMLETRGDWLTELKKKAGVFDANTGRFWLYRGVNDYDAQNMQVDLKRQGTTRIPANRVLSYTVTDGVAVRFAGRGHVPGLVYRIAVDPSELVFFDHLRRWNEGNLDMEDEVVVYHKAEYIINAGSVTHNRIPPIGEDMRVFYTRTEKQKWLEERAAKTQELRARFPELYD